MRQPERSRRIEHIANPVAVAKLLARADDQHFQPFATRHLPARDDVETAMPYFLPAVEYSAGSIVFGVALFSCSENDSASDGNAPARTSAT